MSHVTLNKTFHFSSVVRQDHGRKKSLNWVSEENLINGLLTEEWTTKNGEALRDLQPQEAISTSWLEKTKEGIESPEPGEGCSQGGGDTWQELYSGDKPDCSVKAETVRGGSWTYTLTPLPLPILLGLCPRQPQQEAREQRNPSVAPTEYWPEVHLRTENSGRGQADNTTYRLQLNQM